MAVYSNSKVSTYENCPHQYKLRYIDKAKPEVPETIETFMGSRVHETLEKLYKDKKFKKIVSKAILLKFYNDNWKKEYSDDILVVKEGLTAENYRKMGAEFIEKYYDKYKPFEQLTILGLETTDMMTLPDGNRWHVRIDKFACDDDGNYYVCDYKTNSSMKDQEEADSDRQLAMYSIWVKDKFKDAKSVKLVWHMLAFNKEVISERNSKQEKKLQEEVMEIIREIEKATEEDNFPTNVTGLCSYCGFKSQCPSFKHQVELEEKTIEEFKKDAGVKIVDEFAEVKKIEKELGEKEEILREKLIQYAKQFGIDVVFGSNKKCSVKEFDKIVLPEDKGEFVKLLKEKGLWDELSMISYGRLNSKVLRGEIDGEVRGRVGVEKSWRVSLSGRKEEGEEE